MTVARQAMERARQALAEAIREAERGPSGCLPTLTRLANAAKVSRVVMFRAVREACDAGTLVASRGRRIRLASCPAPSAPSRESGPKWERVKQRLLADLYTGAIPAGPALPRALQLARRYGVSPHTVARALRWLSAQGLLTPDGNQLAAGTSPPALPGSSITLFSAGDRYGNVEESSPWVAHNLRALEHECALHGLGLRLQLWRRLAGQGLRKPEALGRRDACAAAMEDSLGAMVWSQSIELSEVETALERLREQNCPVALLDEVERVHSNVLKTIPDALVVSYDQQRAGYHVGVLLLRRGHRRVLFVCQDLDGAHARLRLHGLKGAFEDAGLRDAVRVFELRQSGVPNPDERAAVPGDAIATEILRRLGFDPGDTPERFALHAGDIKFACDRLSYQMAYEREVSPALDELRRFSDATAWVAVNDLTAIQCQRFALQHGLDRIAVCGFDDSAEARAVGLTSYNFGGESAMRAMVRHVVSPSLTRRLARERPARLRVEGFVVERESTRAPQ